MGDVIGFTNPSATRLNRIRSRPEQIAALDLRQGVASFTQQDMATLRNWSPDAGRLALCASEMGTFAMLYAKDAPWASWGLVRQGPAILVWNCVTLTDLGRFATMREALRSLATADDDEFEGAPSNVIIFAAVAAARGRQAL